MAIPLPTRPPAPVDDSGEPRPLRWTAGVYVELCDSEIFQGRSIHRIDGQLLEDRDGELRPLRWTREEYYRLYDLGLFPDVRMELIGGTIYLMAAMKSPHWVSLGLTRRALEAAFGNGYFVSEQAPIDLGTYDEPEPDFAVVLGGPRDYTEAIPTGALLIVEVSHATLRHDRWLKASQYAAAGIGDYWIVNLVKRRLEVYREPVEDPSREFGWAYGSVVYYRSGESVAALAKPDVVVRVDDLLP